MTDWVWVEEAAVRALHAEQLALFGGGEGMRDLGLLQSALARPLNRAAYGKVDAAELAAAYAFGVARNHPFVDGNKRAALIAAELFLNANGLVLAATDVELIETFLAVAAGEIQEDALAAWFRERLADVSA